MYSNNSLTYVGTTEPNNPKTGDITFNTKTGLWYSYLDNSWIEISTDITTSYSKPKVEYRELKPKTCSHCGAPLHSNKCEYCGVEYY